MSAYSGTPLAKKLNLKDGHRVLLLAMPQPIRDEICSQGLSLIFAKTGDPVDAAHIFVTEKRKLAELITELRERIAQDGMIWVSWPKKHRNAKRTSLRIRSVMSRFLWASSTSRCAPLTKCGLA